MKKVLVVDDSALMRRVLCDIINGDTRFRVVNIAGNGQEALNLLTKSQYDAVVLDVNMPIMNGIEVYLYLINYRVVIYVQPSGTI